MPELNEIKWAREIGYKGHNSYIWLACIKCGKERWVHFRRTQKNTYTGLCHLCNNKQDRPERHVYRENHPSWKGGRFQSGGYIFIRMYPDDFFFPMAKKTQCVAEHRLVMAKHLGRNLHPWEIVHHKNHDKTDNRIENLQLISDDRHKQITILERKIAELQAENKRLKALLNHFRSAHETGRNRT